MLNIDTNLHRLKVNQNIFALGMAKNGCGQFGHGTLKLTVSQEWNDGMNWFFACRCTSSIPKSYFNAFWVGMVRNGHGHLIH